MESKIVWVEQDADVVVGHRDGAALPGEGQVQAPGKKEKKSRTHFLPLITSFIWGHPLKLPATFVASVTSDMAERSIHIRVEHLS